LSFTHSLQDPELVKTDEEEEKSKLEKIQSSLTDAQKQHIIQIAQQLKANQEKQQGMLLTHLL
jgi:Zn-dependent M16 (insulinase) family peptidase